MKSMNANVRLLHSQTLVYPVKVLPNAKPNVSLSCHHPVSRKNKNQEFGNGEEREWFFIGGRSKFNKTRNTQGCGSCVSCSPEPQGFLEILRRF